MERVNCFTANCSCCKHGIKAGKTFYWGEPLYVCKANPKKHKKMMQKIVVSLDVINQTHL